MKQIVSVIVVLLFVVITTTASTSSNTTAENQSVPILTPSTITETQASTTLPTEAISLTVEPYSEIATESPAEVIIGEYSDIISSTTSEPEEEYSSNNSAQTSNCDDYNLDLLARAIYVEAGSNWIPDWVQLYVGSVIINRVNSNLFPNSIEAVLYDPGQYNPSALYSYDPDERTIKNARQLLENGSILPSNVLGQNGDATGDGIYEQYYDAILDSTIYFTYIYG